MLSVIAFASMLGALQALYTILVELVDPFGYGQVLTSMLLSL